MRALVTGAAGFVGSHLAEALLARGDTVVGVDCFTPYYDRRRQGAEPRAPRARDAAVRARRRRSPVDATSSALLDGVDVVFHQAAQAGVRLSWSDGFADYVGHNVLATQRLLEAVQHARPGARVVYASSSSVYGNQPRYPTVEDDLPKPFSPYGVTKLAAEHLCGLYAENWGVSHGVAALLHGVRSAAAPRHVDPPSVRGRDRRHRRSRVYGDGTQIREFTYVDDIVARRTSRPPTATSRPARTSTSRAAARSRSTS